MLQSNPIPARDSWRTQIKTCVHQDPWERSRDPTNTDPDLPVSVWESPVAAWVNGGLLRGQGHWQKSWEVRCVGISPLGGGHH